MAYVVLKYWCWSIDLRIVVVTKEIKPSDRIYFTITKVECHLFRLSERTYNVKVELHPLIVILKFHLYFLPIFGKFNRCGLSGKFLDFESKFGYFVCQGHTIALYPLPLHQRPRPTAIQ